MSLNRRNLYYVRQKKFNLMPGEMIEMKKKIRIRIGEWLISDD